MSTFQTNPKFNYQAILGANNPLSRYPQLYDAALSEFSQNNYQSASLNRILKTGGMAKSSLYYHFGDKFGLYLAMLDIIADHKQAYILPRLDELKQEGDFFTSMRRLCAGTTAYMLADPRMPELSSRFLEEDPKLPETVYEYLLPSYDNSLDRLITAALKSEQIDPKYSCEFLSGLIMLLFSSLTKLTASADFAELEKNMYLVLDILENGIKKREVR